MVLVDSFVLRYTANLLHTFPKIWEKVFTSPKLFLIHAGVLANDTGVDVCCGLAVVFCFFHFVEDEVAVFDGLFDAFVAALVGDACAF